MNTIQITNSRTNQKHDVSVFDFTRWTLGAKGDLYVRVPYLNNNKTFKVKEDFETATQERIELMKNNPDGSLIISNKFKYNKSNLSESNAFVIDLWGDGGTHTVTLPEGVEFIESRVEDYQIQYAGLTSIHIFDVVRNQEGNVITLQINPTSNFKREGDWKLWRGPDWLWGTHVVTEGQDSGKRYIGSFILRFTQPGTFIIPEVQGGYFIVDEVNEAVEPVIEEPAVEPVTAWEEKLENVDEVSGVGEVLKGRIIEYFNT